VRTGEDDVTRAELQELRDDLAKTLAEHRRKFPLSPAIGRLSGRLRELDSALNQLDHWRRAS
jgi:hypothetical protein